MLSNSNAVFVTGLLAALAAPASAFWRLPCVAPLVVERSDPIVNPGALAAHMHTIMGGNGFGFTMDYEDTQKSTCTSCTVKKDLSNYWVPTLFHQAQNGTFTSVKQNGGALVYYLQRTDPKDQDYPKLRAFPKGFRMLAGNGNLRTFSDTLEQKAVSYVCLGISGPETNGFPQQNCPDGLRAQIFFPSCWNGVDLDSPDHKSHMAYPSRVDSGSCPPTHPVRLISIFYEVIWSVDAFKNEWNGGKNPFVWAMGDPTGFGYHGDFVNGWDVDHLQEAVDTCTNLSGRVEDCPVFNLYTNQESQACKIPVSVDEQSQGQMETLPGCNPVQAGPGLAVMHKDCGAPTTFGAPENPYVDMTVTKGFKYLGCGTDNPGGAHVMNSARLVAPDMTNEKCVDFCVSKGYSIAGTEFSNECYCGNTFPTEKLPVPGLMGDCFMKCAGDAKENCGGGGTISLYQKCAGSACQNINFLINNSTSGATPPLPVASASKPVPVASSAASGAISSALAVSTGASSPANTLAPSAPAPTPIVPGAGNSGGKSSLPIAIGTSTGGPNIVGSSANSPVASSVPAGGPVVIIQTQTVNPVPVSIPVSAPSSVALPAVSNPVPVPSYVIPAPVSSLVAAPSDCTAPRTVTVALRTVTITVGATASGNAPVASLVAPIAPTSNSAPLPSAPPAPVLSSAPYAYSNGTVTRTRPCSTGGVLHTSKIGYNNHTSTAYSHGHAHPTTLSHGHGQPSASAVYAF